MKKVVIFILISLVIVFGGKLYLESRYEGKLDQLVRMASSVYTMRYDKVKIGLDGSISLLGFSAQANSGGGAFSMEKAVVVTSNRFFPLFAGGMFKKQDFPSSVDVKVSKLVVDAGVFEIANKSLQCRDLFNTFIYSDIGFDQSIGDMNFSFDYTGDSDVQSTFGGQDQVSVTEVQTSFKKSLLRNSPAQIEELPLSEIKVVSTIRPTVGQNW